MKKTNLILIALFFSLSLVNCSKDLIQETPHFIAPDNLYVNEAGFDAGLNGVYSLVRMERGGVGASSNNLVAAMMMGGTDIIYPGRRWSSEKFLIDWGEDVIGNQAQGYFEWVWNWLYQIVNSTNTIINRAENPSVDLDIPTEKLNRIVAEAKTIRAWAYRHLTYLWGDVPLNITESAGENVRTDWERNSISEIYALMRSDLEYAVQYLPEDHISDSKVVRAVAQHYLMELAINEGNYQEAITLGTDVVNGPKKLMTNRFGVDASNPGSAYTDMFKDGNVNPSEGNTETLWAFQYAYGVEGGDGKNIMRRWFMSNYDASNRNATRLTVTVDRGGRGNTRLAATSFMLNLYDETDDRWSYHAWRKFFIIRDFDTKTIGTYGAVGDTLFLTQTLDPAYPSGDKFRVFTRKWDWASEIDPSISESYKDMAYLRVADTYLLLAEAYFKNGDQSNAAKYINQVRARSNATPVLPSDIDIDFILDERARELYSEEHRRYTLLRNNKWVERVNLHNVNSSGKVTDRDKLYPIPQSFIDANFDNPISNNPGY